MKTLEILVINDSSDNQAFYDDNLKSRHNQCFSLIFLKTQQSAIDAIENGLNVDCGLINTSSKIQCSKILRDLGKHNLLKLPPMIMILNDYDQEIVEQIEQAGVCYWLEHDSVNQTTLPMAIEFAITQHKLQCKISQQAKEIKHVRYHSTLTDLPNRLYFHEALERSVARARRFSRNMATVILNLDHFKSVNDTLGHQKGNKLLQAVTKRITLIIRKNDLLAHLGGDEFGMILDGITDFYGAGIFAERLHSILKAPFSVNDSQIYLTASIGIACFPDNADDADSLIKHADAAVYRVKQLGGNCYQYHTDEMNNQLSEYLETKNSLYNAFIKKEFILNYQPKYNLDTNKVIGIEALIRWQKDERNYMYPDEFIPIAESLGLIVSLGYWIIEEVCQHIHSWREKGTQTVPVAINVSARQLLEDNFVSEVQNILKRYNISGDQLEFELTESVLMSNQKNILDKLKQLKQMGVVLSIDDFGTGFSSLCYLKNLPIDTIKIDHIFIKDIINNTSDRAIVDSIIHLSKSLNIEVIAEGIETQEQLNMLTRFGCHLGQGYYLCQPKTMQEIGKIIND